MFFIMKKLLSILVAALLLPMALEALTLQPNQLLLGHYTTDELNLENGWGKPFLTGVNPIATDLTPDELALFQGSKIVAFRVGLAESAPVTRVFVMPIGTNGKPTGEVIEWPCNVSDQGWNLIELDSPYEINLPEGYSLRIGFDYEQLTRNSTPISAVKEGTIYPSYIFRNNNWVNYGVNTSGNLSVQCIAENDNFPQYIVRTQDLYCKGNLKTGDDLTFSFQAYNLGTTPITTGNLTFDVAIDGTVMTTLSNPADLTNNPITIAGSINTAGLVSGEHTLSVTATTLNGEPIEEPIIMTTTFKNYDFGFTHQMYLVEQFTSTGCTYCPQGSANIQNLTQMRDDIAWVAVHENMNNQDPFRTAQTDSITDLEGIDGFPEATFNRSPGLSASSYIYNVITSLPASTMSTFLDYLAEQNPAWATVNVNSTFDSETRQAVITISGELVPNFDEIMGSGNKLTVYITEDGLVAPQVSGGNNYVHNNVLRKALVSVKGVTINKTGNTYKNEFTYTIPSNWNADNLNIVAFISRPLRPNALTDLYVTNANKRKLGEFDQPSVEPGDVNGDDIINIDDVTFLIDMLLSSGNITEGADVNSDGNINIDDVTALIDKLLTVGAN